VTLTLTAFRYETSSLPAPIIIVYCPAFRFSSGVKVNETCFELPAGTETDSSLNIPVELPSKPVGVIELADTILPSRLLDAFIVTLISAVLPLAMVTSSGAEIVKGICFSESTLPSLFSVHSLNHTLSLAPTENCNTFATPQSAVVFGGHSAHSLFCDGTQYSVNAPLLGSNLAILLPVCSLNHIAPSELFWNQYGNV